MLADPTYASQPTILITPPVDPTLLSNTTASPQPTVSLGPWQEGLAIDRPGPTILENRNEGLDGYPGLKTNSNRARAGAIVADPDITAALPSSDWQAQHNIPVQVIKENTDLFGPASQAWDGFRTDGPGNTPALPKTPEAQQTLAKQGINAPTHNGSHPDWNDSARVLVRNAKTTLADEGLSPGTDGYAERARELTRQIEAKSRNNLTTLDKVR